MSDLPTPPIQTPPPFQGQTPSAPPSLEPEEHEEPQSLVALDRLPTPPHVILLAAVTAIAFVVALVRFPHAVSSGIAYERAQHALEAAKPAEAVTLLEPVVKEFPKSKDARMDLVQAYSASEQYEKAARLLLTFEGEEVTKEEEARLNDLMSNLSSKLHLDDPQDGAIDPSGGEQ